MDNVIDFTYYKVTGKVRKLSEKQAVEGANAPQEMVVQEVLSASSICIAAPCNYPPKRKTCSKKPPFSVGRKQCQGRADWPKLLPAAQCVTNLYADGTCDFLMWGVHKHNAISVVYAAAQIMREAFRVLLR